MAKKGTFLVILIVAEGINYQLKSVQCGFGYYNS